MAEDEEVKASYKVSGVWKMAIILLVIEAIAIAIFIYNLNRVANSDFDKQKSEVNNSINEVLASADESLKVIIEKEENTRRKANEATRDITKEIQALTPDDRVRVALDEIRIFRERRSRSGDIGRP